MFQKFLYDPLKVDNTVEKVICSFLRLLARLGKSVLKESLYKEFGKYPLMVQWLVLAKFWQPGGGTQYWAKVRAVWL